MIIQNKYVKKIKILDNNKLNLIQQLLNLYKNILNGYLSQIILLIKNKKYKYNNNNNNNYKYNNNHIHKKIKN